MINTKTGIKLHNRFDLKLIDSVTGAVKQTAQAENTVLDTFYNLISDTRMRIPNSLQFGTGTGTPSPSDTTLFNYLFTISTTSRDSGVSVISREIDSPTSTLIYSVTVPATSSYVGTLTEIGVVAYTGYTSALVTHAMLSDSEGNPISIEKTELDTLIVTVTLYMTLTSTDNNFIPFVPNGFTDALKISTSMPDALWGTCALYRCATDTQASGIVQLSNKSASYNAGTKTLSIVADRLGTGSGNADGSTYYNGIGITNQGYMRFPNADVFPQYTVNNVSVGTGDAETQDFTCPFALFVKDSDKVYKNGTQLTRGSDYTISNVNYAAGNRCVTAGNFARVEVDRDETTSYTYSIPFTLETYKNYVGCPVADPLVFDIDLRDYDPVIGRAIDGFVVDTKMNGTTSASRRGSYDCTVEYSADKEEWVSVDVTLDTVYKGESGSGSNRFVDHTLTASFDEIDAPYVRITLTVVETAGTYYYTFGTVNTGSALYKKGGPIHFTTAPAEGDVLTMSVKLDRPYKSANYVLDASMSISLE